MTLRFKEVEESITRVPSIGRKNIIERRDKEKCVLNFLIYTWKWPQVDFQKLYTISNQRQLKWVLTEKGPKLILKWLNLSLENFTSDPVRVSKNLVLRSVQKAFILEYFGDYIWFPTLGWPWAVSSLNLSESADPHL